MIETVPIHGKTIQNRRCNLSSGKLLQLYDEGVHERTGLAQCVFFKTNL